MKKQKPILENAVIAECECKNLIDGEILFCELHIIAGELLAATKRLVAIAEKSLLPGPQTLNEIRDLIARAEAGF